MGAAKGVRPDGRQGGRNGIAAQGFRRQQVPGEQFKGGNTESAGRAVEADGNGCVFGQAVQDQNEGVKLGAKSVSAPSNNCGWNGGLRHRG